MLSYGGPYLKQPRSYLVDGADAQHVQYCEDTDASQNCYEYLQGRVKLITTLCCPLQRKEMHRRQSSTVCR